jgi:hypothetical protein
MFETESSAKVIQFANRVQLKSSVDVRIAGAVSQHVSCENQDVPVRNAGLSQSAVTI